MGFPSPATDYQENRLSLDQHCNTGAPGVFFFRSDTYSFREGIKPGALLIVDFGGTPVDGGVSGNPRKFRHSALWNFLGGWSAA